MATPREPTTLALLVCMDIELRPDAMDLLSVRKDLFATGFPAIVPEMCVYWLATNLSPGTHLFQLAITDQDDNDIIPSDFPPWTVTATDPLEQHDEYVELQGLRFPARGEYLIQVKQDGVAVSQRRFWMLGMDERPKWV